MLQQRMKNIIAPMMHSSPERIMSPQISRPDGTSILGQVSLNHCHVVVSNHCRKQTAELGLIQHFAILVDNEEAILVAIQIFSVLQ